MTHANGLYAELPARRLQMSIAALQRGLLWITILSGFFVLREPAPYDLLSLFLLGLFVLTGLRLNVVHLVLIALLFLYHLGAVLGHVPVMHKPETTMWVMVGIFLAVMSITMALIVTEQTKTRMRVITNAYLLSALVASVVGILAYFQALPSAETFLRYDRVKSTFKDPNVFGPFLIFPIIYLVYRGLTGGFTAALKVGFPLAVLLSALFLTFSRGAWAHFILSVLVLFFLCLLLAPRPLDRLRMLLLAGVGAAGLAALLLVLLSFDAVSGLFEQRASLVQQYDAGHLGRLNRHLLGFQMALDLPLGLGPREFGLMFGEEPHNSFLNAFMAYGWLGGLSYIVLIVTTVMLAVRTAFINTPWRPYLLVTLATFIGMAAESWVIDIDHWRHFYLVLGLLWGMIAATYANGFSERRSNFQPRKAIAA